AQAGRCRAAGLFADGEIVDAAGAAALEERSIRNIEGAAAHRGASEGEAAGAYLGDRAIGSGLDRSGKGAAGIAGADDQEALPEQRGAGAGQRADRLGGAVEIERAAGSDRHTSGGRQRAGGAELQRAAGD